HRVDHDHRVGDLAPPRAAKFVDHAVPSCGVLLPPPAKLRSALSAPCHARSTRRPLSAVTTCACPIAIMRARLSSDCSPTRWPRWLTNKALSVTGLNHDRRRRTRSPCWLLTNSNQVPKGRVRRCSYAACSSLLRGAIFGRGDSESSPRRPRALSFIASSVREAGSS